MLAEGGGSEHGFGVVPEVTHSLSIEDNFTNIGLRESVRNASHSRFRNNDLAQSGTSNGELEVVGIQLAALSSVLKLTMEEEIDPALANVW